MEKMPTLETIETPKKRVFRKPFNPAMKEALLAANIRPEFFPKARHKRK